MDAGPVNGVEVRLTFHRVVRGAVTLADDPIDLHGQVVPFRKVQVGLGAVATEVTHADALAQAQFSRGLAADNAHGAAGRVPAEQGALRPLQHLDPLDIVESGTQALGPSKVDPVDVDPDARISAGLVGVEGHDAADADRQG